MSTKVYPQWHIPSICPDKMRTGLEPAKLKLPELKGSEACSHLQKGGTRGEYRAIDRLLQMAGRSSRSTPPLFSNLGACRSLEHSLSEFQSNSKVRGSASALNQRKWLAWKGLHNPTIIPPTALILLTFPNLSISYLLCR